MGVSAANRRIVLQADGRGHFMGQGHLLDSRRLQRHAPPGRAIRLGQHQGDFVSSVNNCLQGLGGELWRSGKNQFHAVTRACLASLFLMRVCFNSDRWSTNTVPFR